MSELTNPLFEEEKEFLERKKLEYERALLGDVEQLKDQSVMVGKVALVGAGLAGGIWLLTKAFGGKKRKKRRFEGPESADPTFEHDDQPEYYTAGNGKRYQSKKYTRSAQDSAQAFLAADDAAYGEIDDLGFGNSAPHPSQAEHFAEEDPFQDLPYDDSRRLPESDDFEDEPAEDYESKPKQSSVVASVVKSFLQSDTGKVIVAQAAAIAMALVTKKLNEFFPADKNADLATSPGYAPASGEPVAGATPASPTPDAIPSNQLPL